MTAAYQYVLFPGRHHVLTRFQAAYLKELLGSRVAPDATVLWAVTSANHHTTKRNPVPFDRREAAIERFSMAEDLRSLVIGVTDTPPTDANSNSTQFAEVTVKAVAAATGDRVTHRRRPRWWRARRQRWRSCTPRSGSSLPASNWRPTTRHGRGTSC